MIEKGNCRAEERSVGHEFTERAGRLGGVVAQWENTIPDQTRERGVRLPRRGNWERVKDYRRPIVSAAIESHTEWRDRMIPAGGDNLQPDVYCQRTNR